VQNLKEQGKKKNHTSLFILVHPTTWATSNPLQNLARISTNSINVYNQNPLKTQSLTLQDFLLPFIQFPITQDAHSQCKRSTQLRF